MKQATVLVLVCLMLSGCVHIPIMLTAGVVGGALGFSANALKLDDDLFNYWAAQRGVSVVPKTAIPAPSPTPTKKDEAP